MSRPTAFGFVCGLAVLLAGCSAPSQADVEKTIRDGMKAERDVDITSINLTRQPEGSYTGTATADNGDTYELTVERPRAGRIRWRAVATQPTVERILREKIEATHGAPVAALELAKEANGEYGGTFTLANGTRWTVTTSTHGGELTWQASLIP